MNPAENTAGADVTTNGGKLSNGMNATAAEDTIYEDENTYEEDGPGEYYDEDEAVSDDDILESIDDIEHDEKEKLLPFDEEAYESPEKNGSRWSACNARII